MSLEFVGGNSAHDGGSGVNATPVNLTLPAHAAGDVGYLVGANSVSGISTTTFNAVSGWTSIASHSHVTGNDGFVEIFRRVFTSASETNPSISTVADSQKSGSVVVFRNNDNSVPGDNVTPTVVDGLNDANRANAAITPNTDNAGLLLVQYVVASSTQKIVTLGAPATPSGLVLLANGQGSVIGGNNHRDLAIAYKLDNGAASLITPGGWTHSTGQQTVIGAQNETNYDNSPSTEGVFNGGSGYSVSDVITLNGGATVTVNAVSGGVVTQFTVAVAADVGGHYAGNTLTQSSVAPSGGSGFTLTLDSGNIVSTQSAEVAAISLVLRLASANNNLSMGGIIVLP